MKLTAKVAVLSSLMLLGIFLLTDPQQLPSVFLIAPFVLLFISFFSFVVFLLGTLSRITKPTGLKIGFTLAFLPVILLVLQSLGQLTIKDLLAIFALFGVAYFYIARFSTQPVS